VPPRRLCRWLGAVVLVLSAVSTVNAQGIPANPSTPMIVPVEADQLPPALGPVAPRGAGPIIPANSPFNLNGKLPDLSTRENFSAAMQIIILMTVLSLAPAILIMMTSFTRMIIVLSLLRQALGTQSLPPNQIIIGLAMFMTFLVMGPTITKINDTALQPYLDGQMEQRTALDRAVVPLRDFMIKQIIAADNDGDVDLFADFAGKPRAQSWDDVGTMTLIPAFVLSELKTAFILGFKVYLPFLIIDMVISTVLISMGMMMLPPVMISLPFKLLLFVLVDGWHLITQRLMSSFAA
jgi:flagellar biosynthetic protein FliP